MLLNVVEMKKKILIIEDEEHIAQAEEMILEDDFDVFVANDGEKGLEMVNKIKPDLVVLDLMLPKRGGYDISFHIRQNPDLNHVKILMVTAKNQKVDMEKGVMVGTNSYLTKPFEAEELLLMVKKLLNE